MRGKQDLKQKGKAENKGSKLSRAVKLAVAMAALGSTAGVDIEQIDRCNWLSPARADAAEVKQHTPAASMIKTANVILKNGLQARMKGDQMFIIGSDGKQGLAKDGTYELMDGKKMIIRNGKAVIDTN